MSNIPIKIDNAAKPIINDSKKTPTSQKTVWLIWLLAVALVAVGTWLAYLLLTERNNPLTEFIPDNSTAIIYFKSDNILNDFKSLEAENYSWPPFVWTAEAIKNLAANNNLAWLNENFKQIFADQMALVLLETNNLPPRWLLLASLEINQNETNTYLDQLEKTLKLRYNLIAELYRQNKIVRIKHLNQNPNDIYYANLKNYLLLANDPDLIKKTIDKIME